MCWERAEALLLAGSWGPTRPLGHAADLGDARPALRLLSHRNAVADGPSVRLDQVEIAIVGIDDDRSGRFPAVIVDDMALERFGNSDLGVRRPGEQFLIVRLLRCGRRRLQSCLDAPAEQQSSTEDHKLPRRHHPPLAVTPQFQLSHLKNSRTLCLIPVLPYLHRVQSSNLLHLCPT